MAVGDRTSNNNLKLRQVKFRLEIRKNFQIMEWSNIRTGYRGKSKTSRDAIPQEQVA